MIPLEELAKHSDKYIGVSEDDSKVLASSKTINGVMKKLEKLNNKNASIMYIPPVDKILTLLCR